MRITQATIRLTAQTGEHYLIEKLCGTVTVKRFIEGTPFKEPSHWEEVGVPKHRLPMEVRRLFVALGGG